MRAEHRYSRGTPARRDACHHTGPTGLRQALRMGRVLALCLTQGVPREHTCFIPKTKSSVLMLICFALALVMSLLALAQEATTPGEMKQDTMKAEKASAKAVSLSGKISADGKTFVDNKSWTVSNPEALKGHE